MPTPFPAPRGYGGMQRLTGNNQQFSQFLRSEGLQRELARMKFIEKAIASENQRRHQRQLQNDAQKHQQRMFNESGFGAIPAFAAGFGQEFGGELGDFSATGLTGGLESGAGLRGGIDPSTIPGAGATLPPFSPVAGLNPFSSLFNAGGGGAPPIPFTGFRRRGF